MDRGGHGAGYVFDTITHAITDALPGDTIMLESGVVYFEHFTITKDLDFRVFNGGQATFSNRIVDAGAMIIVNSGVTANFHNIAIITGANIKCQGIYNQGNLTLENCGFALNGGVDYGSAIYNGGNLTIRNCNFLKNSANDQGGAIFNNGTCTVIDSIFTENSADTLGVGGAINNGGNLDKKASLNVIGCTFNNNRAYYWGGAICNNYDSLCYIADCIFNSNTAGQGGAVCNNWGATTITESTFNGNSAGMGGAFYNGQGSCSLTGSNIFSNSASNKGGAIFNNIGSMTAQFNCFIGNSASSYQGGNTIFGRTNARYNWWGSNNGPSGTNNYYVDDSNWLVLSLFLLDSSSQEIPPYNQITDLLNGGTAKIIANLFYDVNGGYHNSVSNHVHDGITVTFSTDWGTLSSTSTSLTNGQAVITFTANGVLPGPAHINAIVDAANVPKTLNILNNPPVLNPIGNKVVNERQTLSFTTTASDYEGETLSYSATGLPVGASYDPTTGVFTWTPTFDQAEVYTITFTVSAGSLSDSETITITVNNVNRAPITNAGSNQTAYCNDLVNLDGSLSSDPDGDNIYYHWILITPSGSFAVLSNVDSDKSSFTPDLPGNYQLTLTTTDIYSSATSSTVNITVYKIPTTITLNNVRGNQNETVTLKAILKNHINQTIYNKTIEFWVDGINVGENITDFDGIATFNYNITQLHGNYTITAIFNEETQYLASNGTGELYIPKSDLYINISTSKKNPVVGEIFTVFYKLGNKGPDAADNVTIAIIIPQYFKVSKINADGNWTYNKANQTIVWFMANVPVGDPFLNATGKFTQAGSFEFGSSIASETYNLDTQNSTGISTNTTVTVEAANTVEMQNTGVPLGMVAMAIMLVLGGFITPKRKR